jgi:hypothetical protein
MNSAEILVEEENELSAYLDDHDIDARTRPP